jgi:ATP-dependent RNA helicase DeaD
MKFTDLPLPPPLLAALATRGYDTPTGVQAAVLDPGCEGRDLLVSSQTGSGKTIAFGAALAGTLLGQQDGKVPHGSAPIALVIVPTRELAVQVREELRWLLAGTGIRLASFTGGTPVGGDLKVLARGVELVIGTPGRLVDLLRRERLALADLRVVVLDEADEMLDLGFREDLETLLQAAPAERRTLLLSATLPPDIRGLARRYQRDALPIDPRKLSGEAPGPGRGAHGDITHRAHLIAGGDRTAAVVNVLRAGAGDRAIVFCTTREGVAEMHSELARRGFAATAISGDRAQAERDRALEQLRRGDAQVLVATNVAARGLHLPDVDLIVHADLPLNADSLIHRSGRTGRAGRKGTAVVLATLAERRKAERLLGAAQVSAPWTPVPSAAAIAAAARARLADEIVADAPPTGGEPESPATSEGDADDLRAHLEAKLGTAEIIRRLLNRELGRLPTGEALHVVDVPRERGDDDRGRGPRPPRPRGEFSRDAVTFRVNLGGKDNADPRWLLPLICRRGDITRREVGAIRIGPRDTLFEISGDAARDFELAARERDPRALHVTIERADGPGPGGPPPPAPVRSRPARPHSGPARPHAGPARPHAGPARPHAGPPARPHSGPPAKPHSEPPAKPHAGPGAKPHAGPPAKPHAGPPAKPYLGPPARPHAGSPARKHAGPPTPQSGGWGRYQGKRKRPQGH